MSNKPKIQPVNGQGSADASKPVLLAEMKIRHYSDGTTQVSNFPSNKQQAMSVLFAAMAIVTDYFINEAKAGNMQDSRILVPQPGLVIPGRG